MPFYLRKSRNIGPLRVNLSKSGLGISVGVKGARIGTGPRGGYVHAGRKGLYYRKQLGGTAAQRTVSRGPTAGRTLTARERAYVFGFLLLLFAIGVWFFKPWAGVALAIAAIAIVVLTKYGQRSQVAGTIISDGYKISVLTHVAFGLTSQNYGAPPMPGYKYADVRVVVENLTRGPLTPGIWTVIVNAPSKYNGFKYVGYTRGDPIPWMGLKAGSTTRQIVTFTIPKEASIRQIRAESDPRTGNMGALTFTVGNFVYR